jgi:hypothetical protein
MEPSKSEVFASELRCPPSSVLSSGRTLSTLPQPIVMARTSRNATRSVLQWSELATGRACAPGLDRSTQHFVAAVVETVAGIDS